MRSRAGTQNCAVFLQRKRFRIGLSQQLQRRDVQFDALSFPRRFLEFAVHGDTGTGADVFNCLVITGDAAVDDDLQILHAAPVVQLHKRESLLGIPPSAHPAFHLGLFTGLTLF